MRSDFSTQAAWLKSLNSLLRTETPNASSRGDFTLILGVVATLGSHWHVSHSTYVVYWPRIFPFHFWLKCLICWLLLSVKWSMSSNAGGKIGVGCKVKPVDAAWLCPSPDVSYVPTHHCSIPGPAVLMVGGLMVRLGADVICWSAHFSKECTGPHTELWILS